MKTYILPPNCLWPLGCLLGASWVPPGCFLGTSWVLLDASWVFTAQEYRSSCSTRRHVSLSNLDKKTCPLLSKKSCLPAEQEETFFLNKKIRLLIGQASCPTRGHVFLSNKRTRPLVQQEDMSSCSTRRPVFLFNKKRCLLVQQGVLRLSKKTCRLA